MSYLKSPLKKHRSRPVLVFLIFIAVISFSGCITDDSTNIPEEFNNSIGMGFVLIPDGEFYMGSDSTPIIAFDDPLRKVTITNAFYMAECEVTQDQWETIMGNNPSHFEGDGLPVEQVSWYDAQEFIDKLNEIENTDKYRLPTEAEWEYACRAGTTTDFSFTEEATDLDTYGWSDDHGWCAINSNSTTHPVGWKEPNAWGLYDMHGNVWEWVQDIWQDNYEGAPVDGSSWDEGEQNIRVGRGGSWMDGPNICKSAFRGSLDADSTSNVLGFRLVKAI
ncbi:formylglycine-generating enzyme family protein [Methanolobus psychrotolerans]|uniref:formylglycine-generating enzyme family protein n=1 Tax=Methanolobus psychrotolerans TaxID=1874706 RepID=UPI001F5C749C|nr:formylglycine-generating enzyme family protein [Methanolobus psychrotolerans]